MKIWHLHPKTETATPDPWIPADGCTWALVVRAESEDEARRLADTHEREEVQDSRLIGAWLDPSLSHCDELTGEGAPGVVVADFYEP